MDRSNKHEYYCNIAVDILNRSTCLRRKYGAVIVKNDEIIATGYNGAPRKMPNCCDIGMCMRDSLNIPKGERYELCASVHAECNAIISAQRDRMIDATIYIVGYDCITHQFADPSPCIMCSRMIVNAGITEGYGFKKNSDKEVIELDVSAQGAQKIQENMLRDLSNHMQIDDKAKIYQLIEKRNNLFNK